MQYKSNTRVCLSTVDVWIIYNYLIVDTWVTVCALIIHKFNGKTSIFVLYISYNIELVVGLVVVVWTHFTFGNLSGVLLKFGKLRKIQGSKLCLFAYWGFICYIGYWWWERSWLKKLSQWSVALSGGMCVSPDLTL